MLNAIGALIGIKSPAISTVTQQYRFNRKGILSPTAREVIHVLNDEHKHKILTLLNDLPKDTLIGGSYALRSYMISKDPDTYWVNNDIDVFVNVKSMMEYKHIVRRFSNSFDNDKENLLLSEKHKYYPDANRSPKQKETEEPDSHNEEFHLNVMCVSTYEICVQKTEKSEFIQIVGILPLEFNKDYDYLKKTKSGHCIIKKTSEEVDSDSKPEDLNYNYRVRYYASLFDTLNQIVDLPTKVFIDMKGNYRVTAENSGYIESRNIPRGSICPMRYSKYVNRGFTFFGPEVPWFVDTTTDSEKYPSLTEKLIGELVEVY